MSDFEKELLLKNVLYFISTLKGTVKSSLAIGAGSGLNHISGLFNKRIIPPANKNVLFSWYLFNEKTLFTDKELYYLKCRIFPHIWVQ